VTSSDPDEIRRYARRYAGRIAVCEGIRVRATDPATGQPRDPLEYAVRLANAVEKLIGHPVVVELTGDPLAVLVYRLDLPEEE
jgi:hypothetical protein